MAGQLQTLQNYLDAVRRLLHDPLDRYWSQADKTVYINEGMQQRDLETGINRTLIPFTLTPGTDTYSFTQFGNGNVFDVVGINLLFQNLRIVMDQRSFTMLNVEARQYNPPLLYCPLAWARYGPNSIVFGPSPSLAYGIEVDACVYQANLVNLTDQDVIPFPYTNPVPFYAAYKAKLNERQYDEASDFFAGYKMQLQTANNSRVGVLPTAYRGGLTWVQ